MDINQENLIEATEDALESDPNVEIIDALREAELPEDLNEEESDASIPEKRVDLATRFCSLSCQQYKR